MRLINMIEYPTEELRQVRHEVGSRGIIGALEYSRIKYIYYKTQRKWTVQDGDIIRGFYGHLAEYVRVYDGFHPTRDLWEGIRGRGAYAKLKEEWRDLPEVKSEEST